MEKNEHTVDCTEELVKSCEPCKETCTCEEACTCEHSRSLSELMNEKYGALKEHEKEYLISALKVKLNEVNRIAERAFDENRKIKEARQNDLKLMEDTLTFIKTTVGNAYGSVSLAIKNMQMEVK